MTTVNELIEQLSKMPGDLPVFVDESNRKMILKKIITVEGIHNMDLRKVNAAIIKVDGLT